MDLQPLFENKKKKKERKRERADVLNISHSSCAAVQSNKAEKKTITQAKARHNRSNKFPKHWLGISKIKQRVMARLKIWSQYGKVNGRVETSHAWLALCRYGVTTSALC